MAELEGRRALVCGASKGIGRATARALAERGAGVAILARDPDRLRIVAEELRALGGDVRILVADLDDRATLVERVTALAADWGAIHLLVNNTGGPASGPLLQATDDAILSAFNRHILAAQALVRALLPGMRDAGYGRIVNVLSTSVREPIDNLGVSNLIRAAHASWSKTLSRELPPGVTINNVLPGYTDTERLSELAAAGAQRSGRTADAVRAEWVGQIPEGRLARPEELGAVIAFLASPAASYVRGVSLPVDGGRLRSL